MVESALSRAVWRGLENVFLLRACGVAGFASRFGVFSASTTGFVMGVFGD
jgi:hypothetical protein